MDKEDEVKKPKPTLMEGTLLSYTNKEVGVNCYTVEGRVFPYEDTNELTLTLVDDDTGIITYASSDESKATVSTDGTITCINNGDVKITASKQATDKYKASSDSYTLTIKKVHDRAATVRIANRYAANAKKTISRKRATYKK